MPLYLYQIIEVPCSCFKGINSRGIDTAVTEYIGEAYNIFFYAVKYPGKQMAQIVWIDLFGRHICFFAQAFHLSPDTAAIQRFPVLAYKHRTGCDAGFFDILLQNLLQRRGDKNDPRLIFAVYHSFSVPDGLQGDILQFRNSDSGAADGLQDERKLRVSGAPYQPLVFGLCQFFFLRAEDLPLDFQGPNTAIL